MGCYVGCVLASLLMLLVKEHIAKARVSVEFTKSVKELIPMQTIPSTFNLA